MNYIHETILRDLIDLGSDLKDSDTIQMFTGRKYSQRSIASAASNLTMVFPVLCTRSINIEHASMITKAIERKATTMLSLLFAAKQSHNTTDITDYLKKFHTNLKIDNNISVDGVLDLMDKIVTEQTDTQYTNIDIQELYRRDRKNLNSYLEDNICETCISDYDIVPKSRYGESYIIENDNRVKKARVNMGDTKSTFTQNNLLSTDVRKANELTPTTMIVNYLVQDDNKVIPRSSIVGVKAKLYPIDSMDAIDKITEKSKDSNGLNKFIRATTREISFVKDFLFAIDKAKVDAISQSNRGSSSKLWKILERRSKKSKFRRNLGMVNDATAITTLVVSQEEVDYIKKEYNINIENPSVIRPILEAYNLMGFCIVDQSNEVAKFIFDTGEDIYEELSFNSLERETNDGGYKKVINLISKMNR